MTAPIRVLVVDDEPHARAGLVALLGRQPRFQVVGQSGDGRAAVAAIGDLAPELVLLDIQMPGMDGFEVIRAVGVERMPATVFVTAHDDYAVDAFEVAALDYVLKPFTDQRLFEALNRAAAASRDAHNRELTEKLIRLVSPDQAVVRPAATFLVRSGIRTVLVRAAEIDWIEAANYQAKIHVGERIYFHRESMAGLEQRLASDDFVRTHRSAIVRVALIMSLERRSTGDHVALLKTGARVPVGRQRWTAVTDAMRGAHSKRQAPNER